MNRLSSVSSSSPGRLIFKTYIIARQNWISEVPFQSIEWNTLMKDSYPAQVSCCTWILCDQHCIGDQSCEKTGLHCLKLPLACLYCPTLVLGICSEWLSLLLRAQHHEGPLWRSDLGLLHIILFHILCPGLSLCCAETLLGAMKAGAKHAGTTKTLCGMCVLPQKSLIPLVTPVNLFPQQACTGSCSCPKETSGRTSVSERLSNSVHNCRDMSIISNSLCRKGGLFFLSDCVATESGHPVQIL